ncbi:MAG: T9SS type A sorting domain-containing protein, partial [Bacteroidota bacterium]
VPLSYIIVEDGVMFREEPFTEDALTIAETVEFILPDPDKSYWIQSNQEPFSPGDPMPTAFSAGCSTNPDGSFANQFGNGDETYWYEEVCLPNIGAFDPNDKTALPVGYGIDRFIEPTTPIDYLIRFQNTGTDTAFHVRLVDTLDSDLDLSTFEVLSASHEFRPELDTAGVLTIYFDNIMLPDSNIDLRGSNGFFSYRIQPRADLELPFIVTNRAGIYFDFNEPIITNTVLHTVDTGFIEGPNSVSRISRAIANLQVSPNPSPSGRFDVDIETARPGPFMLRLSDQLGRTVRTHEQVDKQSSLDYSKLPNGVYYLSAFDQNGLWLVTKQIIR